MHYITVHYITIQCIAEEGGRRLTETLIDDVPAAPPAGEIPSTTAVLPASAFNVKSQILNVLHF